MESRRSGSGGLVDPYHVLPYADAVGLVETIRQHLSNCGVRPGDCVSLELANTVASAATLLAVLDAGLSAALMPIEGRGARASGRSFPGPRFSRWIVTVQNGPPLMECDLTAPASYLHVRLNPDFDADVVRHSLPERLYLRTSGSLGAPKLVVRHLASFMRNVMSARERIGFGPEHRVALPVPLFHAYGLGPAFLGCLLGGASVDLQERANLLRYLEREQVFEPNVAFVTPSFCEILARGRKAPRRYAFMITGGDRIGRSTFFRSEELHGPLINAYGSTEMGFAFAGDLDMSSELRSRTVGRPLPGVSFRIVAAAGGTDSGAGALQIKYADSFEGYVDLSGAALPVDAVFDDGWYRTGDLAKLGPDGTLEVLGRSDQSVNRNGVLVTFADVEAVLREIEGIGEAAVSAGRDNIRGRALVAFCVLERDVERRSEEELRRQCAARAPAFAVPEYVRVVDELPKLSNGKLDRIRLAAMAELESTPPT